MSVALARKPDERSDPRAALREAIAAAASAREEVVAIQEAIERAHGLSMASRRKLEAATKAIAVAKREDAEQLADALVRGTETTPVQTINRAREEMAAAGDALEASRAAVTRLESVDLKDAEDGVARANKDVTAAIAALLKPVAQRMLAEVHSRKKAYLTAQAALSALGSLWNPWDDIAKQIDRTSSANEDGVQASAASRKQWESAIAALRLDPDVAELPSLED